MAKYKEPDFGQPHETALIMNDDQGTAWVCHYSGGIWWEGHPGDTKIQVNRPIVGPVGG